MADRTPDRPIHSPDPSGDDAPRWATAAPGADPAPTPPGPAAPRPPRRRPRRRLPAEILTDGEVRALMAACDPDTVIGLRHRALLAVLYRAGLRIAEVPITYHFTNSSLRREIVTEALRTCGRLWRDGGP